MAERGVGYDKGETRRRLFDTDKAYRPIFSIAPRGLGVGYDNVNFGCTVENQRRGRTASAVFILLRQTPIYRLRAFARKNRPYALSSRRKPRYGRRRNGTRRAGLRA